MQLKRPLIVAIALSAVGFCSVSQAQSCGVLPGFEPGFTAPPSSSTPIQLVINAMAAHDDGSGQAMYVAGNGISFGQSDPVSFTHSVARYRGRTAEGVGYRTSGTAYAIASLDLGANAPGGARLYATGFDFRAYNAAGNAVMNFAMWDRQRWNAVGDLNPPGRAMCTFDDGRGGGTQLYVAGDPLNAAGSLVSRWNGTAWEVLPPPAPTGNNAAGYSLTVFDDGAGPALYLAGSFGSGSGDLSGLARWNGQAWDLLSAPSPGATLTSVRGFAGKLYVGGYFSLPAGGQKGVARRNTDGTWTGIGAATDFSVAYPVKLSVVSDAGGPALYIAGLSWMPDGAGTASILGAVLRYDGFAVTSPLQAYASFSNGGVGSGRGVVGEALEFDRGDGPAVYLSGRFSAYSDATTAPLPLTAPARSIVRVPQTGDLAGQVLELGSGVNMQVDTVTSWVPNMQRVVFEGREQLAFFGHVWGGGGQPSFGYVLFDGEHWTTNPQRVTAPSTLPPFLAGVTAQVNGVERLVLAPNTGTQLGYVTPGSTTLTPYGPAAVLLSGSRQLEFFDDGLTGGPALYLSSYSGIQRLVNNRWNIISGGSAFSMLVGDLGDGPRLYAGLSSSSGQVGVGVWNGTSFDFLGTPGELPVGPSALIIHDDGNGPRLYASFEGVGTAGGQPLRRIAKLEGSHWEPLGDGLFGGISILGLASFDDGSGPALYAAGDFTQAGALPSKGFARWRGGSWEPVLDINRRLAGAHRADLSLAVLGDTLYLSGMFSETGLRPAGAPINISANVMVGENLVAIRRCPPACFPDLNQDGNTDQGDIDYLINIAAGGPNPTGARTDLNDDGTTDMGDVDVLINVVAGAPCQ